MALYPPIVASSMPAFNINDGAVKIYFEISDYNGTRLQDINDVQISVRRQSSNVNVVNTNTNSSGYLSKTTAQWGQAPEDVGSHRYYVEIFSGDLTSFEADVLYKVQLRFTSGTSLRSINSFQSLSNFSEWSTVCIIKGINPPKFYIDEFHVEGHQPKESDENNFNYRLADFTGVYTQNNGQQKSSEILEKWRVRLLDPTFSKSDYKNGLIDIDDYTLIDSGINMVSSYSYISNDSSIAFECSLPFQLRDNEKYKIFIWIETKNGYFDYKVYSFTCKPSNIGSISGTLSAVINQEQGYIKLKYQSADIETGNYVIRRSSSKDNFLKWEDLKNFVLYDNQTSYEYYDFTAESGLIYDYLIQKRDKRGRRGEPLKCLSHVMGEWQHAFLLQSTDSANLDTIKQLKLKFDFQISSYKTNIAESKTDTIGSKYPYIRRNGNMYYRSFPCTGTITAFMDNTDLFTSAEQIFDNHLEEYNTFDGNYDIWVNRYNYTYERKFRQKVQEFLYNSKPKLYKSMQQGNILIKLMQVSLTPKNQLGRLVYIFSATAYEIDQASIPNLNKYGFINIGTYNPQIVYSTEQLKQLSSFGYNQSYKVNLFLGGKNIINAIKDAVNYNKIINGDKVIDFKITWLRMTIESDPYLIVSRSGKYIALDESVSAGVSKPINKKLYQIQSTYNQEDVYLGTLFEIDGQSIIVSPPNNIYELKDKGIRITPNSKIIPLKDTVMTVDFMIELAIQGDAVQSPRLVTTDTTNGQLFGTYSTNTEIISRIGYKYAQTIDESTESSKKITKQYLAGVKTINIETDPGVIIQVRTGAQEDIQNPHRFIVNETGELFFDPCVSDSPMVYITYFKIKGKNLQLEKFNDRRNQTFQNLQQITYPVVMDLFSIENYYGEQQLYVYYKRKFYEAEQKQDGTIDVFCPIDALIFYYADIGRDVY